MNILGCLDRPSGGRYWLDGEEVSQISSDQRALVRNRKIGFVFQNFNLLPRTSAIEQVMMPLTYTAAELSERSGLRDPLPEGRGIESRLRRSRRRLAELPDRRRVRPLPALQSGVDLDGDPPLSAEALECGGHAAALSSEGRTAAAWPPHSSSARMTAPDFRVGSISMVIRH